MATLHIMVGLPCSGKTTRAKQLEAELPALRLTPDEWHLRLFGQDAEAPEHDEAPRRRGEHHVAGRPAGADPGGGCDLDFGFWSREERDGLRAQARALGVGFEMHYLALPEEELLRRLRARNRERGSCFVIPERAMRATWPCFSRQPSRELRRAGGRGRPPAACRHAAALKPRATGPGGFFAQRKCPSCNGQRASQEKKGVGGEWLAPRRPAPRSRAVRTPSLGRAPCSQRC